MAAPGSRLAGADDGGIAAFRPVPPLCGHWPRSRWRAGVGLLGDDVRSHRGLIVSCGSPGNLHSCAFLSGADLQVCASPLGPAHSLKTMFSQRGVALMLL